MGVREDLLHNIRKDFIRKLDRLLEAIRPSSNEYVILDLLDSELVHNLAKGQVN